MKKLSIVIPVYNEARTVEILLDKVLAAPLSIDRQIVIVNDGSTDGSERIIRDWTERHKSKSDIIVVEKPNGGKGSAVREGIRASTGDIVIVQDADLEYDPEDYESCIEPILAGRVKAVYGSREASNRNRIYSSPAFYLGGLSLTCWINLLYGSDLTDEPTCYKTFDGPLIRAIPLEGDKFDWEPEISSKLLRLGYEIEEVPISYHPRKVNDGKKIKWKDGVAGFWVSLIWRFKPLADVKKSLLAKDSSAVNVFAERRRMFIALGIVIALACIVRLACAIPGLSNPELLMRPDSASYLGPAKAMIEDFAYNTSPGSGVPAIIRTPLYPLFLAATLLIGNGSLAVPIVISSILGGLICLPIFLCGRFFGGWRTGFMAALLFALNPTAIALSPMFLSDTLFCLLIAFQLHFILRHWKTGLPMYAWTCAALAAAATLVRPLNQFWLLPLLTILILSPEASRPTKLISCTVSILVFLSIICPWMLRNESKGAGFRIDAISGEVLFHNGAVLLSSVSGGSPADARKRLEAEMSEDFKDSALYPDEKSRIAHKESRFFEIVKSHPMRYALLHLRPYTMIPDLPSLLQNLGATTGEKGTFDVLSKEGLMPALKHYFKGQYSLLLICIPMLLIVLLTYASSGIYLLQSPLRLELLPPLLFAAFAAYYLLLPGPINMPRYQLPTLPLLCLFAAPPLLKVMGIASKLTRKRQEPPHQR